MKKSLKEHDGNCQFCGRKTARHGYFLGVCYDCVETLIDLAAKSEWSNKPLPLKPTFKGHPTLVKLGQWDEVKETMERVDRKLWAAFGACESRRQDKEE